LNKRLGILLMVAQQLCFAAENAAIHQVGHDYGLMQLAFMRAAGCVVLALCLLPQAGGWSALRTQYPKVQLVRGVASIAYLAVLLYSLANMPLADASAISYTTAVYIVLFSHPILGEIVGVRRWFAVVIGLAGALALIKPSFSMMTVAMYLVVLAGTSLNGFSYVLTRVMQRDHAVTVLFFTNAMILVAFSPGALEPWPAFSLWVLPFVILGPLGMYLGIAAVRYAELSTLAPYTYSRQIVIAFIAPLVFGETITWQVITGSGLIIAACAISGSQRAAQPSRA
jgi:drug/metabolite transporter (DMT)-like permease